MVILVGGNSGAVIDWRRKWRVVVGAGCSADVCRGRAVGGDGEVELLTVVVVVEDCDGGVDGDGDSEVARSGNGPSRVGTWAHVETSEAAHGSSSHDQAHLRAHMAPRIGMGSDKAYTALWPCFGSDPNSWLSCADNRSRLGPLSSLSTASVSAAAGTDVDCVLFNDLVEMVPLVQSLIDGKANPSFTRLGSMIRTKMPSRESLHKKFNVLRKG
ncbi:Disease resistance RPP13-like protein 4 [Olea europaea subsp. europaea]|uniref:Disease resistance RPP13-like protein 4 n=1 Tax=Olea europaea subsp. europaea TaxID=158383 RepID=A0A8S0RJE4_OLEEU|nr:Disease resistance RPP13-like protein 4 [Olea europaea subsp. europaea]